VLARLSLANLSLTSLLLALALVHHLAIGKNIPLEMVADMFSRIGSRLIIEFVPKDDEKVKEMLSRKKDIYIDYSEEGFIAAFEKYFTITKKNIIPGSSRALYLMQKKDAD